MHRNGCYCPGQMRSLLSAMLSLPLTELRPTCNTPVKLMQKAMNGIEIQRLDWA